MVGLIKIKRYLKDTFYYTCFLFRPIITIGVSFIFMIISLGVLFVVMANVSENTRTYEVLLALLTGLTASFFVTITIELCNNYRFNYKRHRELRKYLGFISYYKLHQNIYIKSRNENEIESKLGSGNVYYVFTRLNKIIPQLRESLLDRDYLYHNELEEIDNIIYEYEFLIKYIEIELLSIYLDIIKINNGESNNSNNKEKELFLEKYPELFKFLEEEWMIYSNNSIDKSCCFYDEARKHLGVIVERAIFYNPEVFTGYFEITDKRYIKTEEKMQDDNLEYLNLDESPSLGERRYDFLSNMISYKCGEIDKSIIKLVKRAAKEPHLWMIAEKGLDK